MPKRPIRLRNFFCHREGRFLTDDEFLERAFLYEVHQRNLPEPQRSLGISGVRELDPNCCEVLREDNPFNEPWYRSWISRLLTDPLILVLIDWDMDPNEAGSRYGFGTDHTFTICGYLGESRGSNNG